MGEMKAQLNEKNVNFHTLLKFFGDRDRAAQSFWAGNQLYSNLNRLLDFRVFSNVKIELK